jgi:hypothetical protein
MVDIRRTMGLGSTKSAYRSRKEGDYPRIERLLRSALTLDALKTIWILEWHCISEMSPGWRRHLIAEKDRLKALLEGQDG